jgi:hypothetical protein
MTEDNHPLPKMPADGFPFENSDEHLAEPTEVTGRGFGEVGDSRSPGDVEVAGEGDEGGHAADGDLGPLFDDADVKDTRGQWHNIQASFVDDPHAALKRADELNDQIVRSLTSALETRRRMLQEGIANADTEQLRMGLRHYGQLLDRILAL